MRALLRAAAVAPRNRFSWVVRAICSGDNFTHSISVACVATNPPVNTQPTRERIWLIKLIQGWVAARDAPGRGRG